MEAGYDYLLVRKQFHNNLLRYSGLFLLVFSAVLLTVSVAYFVYTQQARSNLDNLNYAVPASLITTQPVVESTTVGLPVSSAKVGSQSVTTVSTGVQAVSGVKPVTGVETVSAVQGELAQARESVATESVATETSQATAISDIQQPLLQLPIWAIAQQQLYPGEALRASVWSNPLVYEPTSYIETRILGQFKPIGLDQIAAPGTLLAPTRITIPSIDVESKVSALQIMNLGDSRAYETPKNTVGHIPQSVNAGEMGSAWFFGHLESPIMNEGAVFYNLPKIPGLLRNGEQVYVIVEAGESAYLYKITEAIVVGQDELKLNYQALKDLKPQYAQLEPGGANLHLVACVPRWDYSRRLVVSGTLVGIN